MQSIQILLNRTFTANTAPVIQKPSLVDDYYVYQNSNGGGLVNFSNVRGFLNDTKNQQIIRDFFAYLTGRTTREQTINIVSSDEKLSDVFNDYYQRLIKSARTTNLGAGPSFASVNGTSGSDTNSTSLNTLNNLTQDVSGALLRNDIVNSNSETISVTIINTDNPTQGARPITFGESSNLESSVSSASAESPFAFSFDNSNADVSPNYVPPSVRPIYSMTATIAKNLVGGYKGLEKVFYHNWNNQQAVYGGMQHIPLSIRGENLLLRNKNIWVDTTSEESYYVNVKISRSTNQISRNVYDPDFVRIPKKTISLYPEYSGFTDMAQTDNSNTKINSIINSFIDLNLETNENTFILV